MTLCVATRLIVEIPDAIMGALVDADAGILHSLDVLEAAVAHFLVLVVYNLIFTALTVTVLVIAISACGDLVLRHQCMLG